MNQPIPVVFFPANIDACALFRMFIPHLNTPNSQFVLRYGALDVREFSNCKVAVVQRQVSEMNLHAIRRLKASGIKVIYDLDDNIWNLTSANPAKETFDAMRDGFNKCAREADIITVSTPGLASATRTSFGTIKDIQIIPNAIDFKLFKPKNFARNDEKVLIGWGGSTTHSEDTAEAFDAITEVLDANPQAIMQVAGASAHKLVDKWTTVMVDGKMMRRRERHTVESKMSTHPQLRYKMWVPVGEYPNRLASWGWDIATAPLVDSRFNRSKSNIKMLEAGALKIPCLASAVQPYIEFAELGGDDLKWLLCHNARQWKEKLNELINNKERREYLGQKMYEIAYKFYNIETVVETWKYTFNKVLTQ